MQRFFFLIFLLFSFLLGAFAEPPIEVIYWKSADVAMPSVDKIEYLGEVMVEVQSFFASEMNRYGFGPKTFAFNPNIRVVNGKHKLHH